MECHWWVLIPLCFPRKHSTPKKDLFRSPQHAGQLHHQLPLRKTAAILKRQTKNHEKKKKQAFQMRLEVVVEPIHLKNII